MPASTLNVLQFTDTHIYDGEVGTLGGLNTRETCRAVLDFARTRGEPVDLILLTGDLAAAADAGGYTWLVERLTRPDIPVLCIPGNHDDPRIMGPIVEAAGWCAGGSYRLGGWHFILLDSSVPGEEYGELFADELNTLARQLDGHRELPTVVVLHHHPLPMGSRWMDTMTLRDAAQFWHIIDRHPQVRAVVWGHVHQNYDSYRNGVRLLATPSTCVQFAARAVNFAIDPLPPAYRWLRLAENGGITSEVVRLR